jgi:hypothetical protein
MPPEDEMALLRQIDSINSRRWQAECECKKLEPNSIGPCMAGAAQGFSREINAVQENLRALCAYKNAPQPAPPVDYDRYAEEADEGELEQRAGMSTGTMAVGGILLLVLLGGGYMIYRGVKK